MSTGLLLFLVGLAELLLLVYWWPRELRRISDRVAARGDKSRVEALQRSRVLRGVVPFGVGLSIALMMVGFALLIAGI